MMTEKQVESKAKNVGIVSGLLMESRRKGMTRAILRIPVDLLMIDERYQIPIRSERNMNYLVNNWDEHKLLPLTIVPHDEDGVFAIVDGFGRYTASQKIDPNKYKELDCLVILDAPTDADERLKFEAEQYAFQNANVARMKALHKHGAMQIMNDPATLLLDKMQEKYGFEFSAGGRGGRSAANVIGSYPIVLSIARYYGEECLDYIFSIIRDSGLNRQYDGYARAILRMLRDIYSLYGVETREFMVEKMRGTTQQVLLSLGRAKYPILDSEIALSLYMEDLIVKELGREQKRTIRRGKGRVTLQKIA